LFIGVYLPLRYLGSFGAMFHQSDHAKPGFAALTGVIGSAGMLCALVPGSMLLIVCATTVARNVYRGVRPDASEATVRSLTEVLVPVVALGAVAFVLQGGQTIVTLLLLG
jgi:SSS family solute:Na+ symporter